MDFEWDDAKRLANIAKHGVDLADGRRLDWRSARYFADDYIEGETRARALALLEDRLMFVVYTLRGDRCRLTSLRRATRNGHRIYGNG